MRFGNLNFGHSDLFRTSALEFQVFILRYIVFFETVSCVNRSPEYYNLITSLEGVAAMIYKPL